MKRDTRCWTRLSIDFASGVGFERPALSTLTGLLRRYAMLISACINCGKRSTSVPNLFALAECSKMAVVRCSPIARVTRLASRTNESHGSRASVPSGLLFFEY